MNRSYAKGLMRLETKIGTLEEKLKACRELADQWQRAHGQELTAVRHDLATWQRQHDDQIKRIAELEYEIEGLHLKYTGKPKGDAAEGQHP